ncbi:hypothetical protein DXG01_013177 [Tephrocybe rancida]|nr:hypothetical protein DXG01_013177 [Tephrocybe rancida]
MRSGFRNSGNLINRLILFSINIGLLTSAITACTLITYLVLPNLPFYAIYAINVKVQNQSELVFASRGEGERGEWEREVLWGIWGMRAVWLRHGGARNQGTAEGSIKDEDKSDEEVSGEASSTDHVLADLEVMDNCNNPPQPQWRKPAPAPTKIPNAAFHNPKVQLLPSSDAPRPTSTISSPESSAVTLARALMANTFVLSGDARQS